jgi:hypothetical protein
VRLNLHSSIFHEKYDIELSQILIEAYRKRVSIHIKETVAFENWIKEKSRLDKDKWALIIKASFNLHTTSKTSCVFELKGDIGASVWDNEIPLIAPIDLDYILTLPIVIALENGRNDRNFLLCLGKSSLRERLLELEAQNALVYDGVGGINELVIFMKGKYSSNPAHKYKYWLLFDGDAPTPGSSGNIPKTLIELCKVNSFNNFHCLRRRAIENYLPISDLSDLNNLYDMYKVDDTDFKEQLVVFGKLSAVQRHHYHMKEGLRKLSCKKSGLFDNFCITTKKLIGRGFNKRIDSIFDFGHGSPAKDYEKLHQLLVKEGATKELADFLKQLDFNTRKMK